jgi:hypothetical protein
LVKASANTANSCSVNVAIGLPQPVAVDGDEPVLTGQLDAFAAVIRAALRLAELVLEELGRR